MRGSKAWVSRADLIQRSTGVTQLLILQLASRLHPAIVLYRIGGLQSASTELKSRDRTCANVVISPGAHFQTALAGADNHREQAINFPTKIRVTLPECARTWTRKAKSSLRVPFALLLFRSGFSEKSPATGSSLHDK
jgi:hypothetical protein